MICIAATGLPCEIYVGAKLIIPRSFLSAMFRRLIQLAELLHECVVRLPKFQAVQTIPRFRRQLNRREILDTICHGGALAPIVLCAHIVLCVVNVGASAHPIYVRITEAQWQGGCLAG